MYAREMMVRHHLGYNHFPPIDPMFDASALRAIDLANGEDWDAEITMPNGVTLTVGEIVEGLHLDGFLELEEEP
jgi:hypothetical protein